MGPTSSLTYLLHHVAAVTEKQTDTILQEHLNVGLSQYRVLSVLEWTPRIQQQVIAQTLGQTEASISRQLAVLQKRGLVSIQKDAANGRSRIVVATPLGMQITEAATALLRRTMGPEFAKLGEANMQNLIEQLQALHKIICGRGKTGACDHKLGY